MASVLAPDAQIFGIDLEDAWIKQATHLAVEQGLNNRCHYQVGNALNIEYPDNSFDLVTCQTLLIHLKNPSDALKEFIRVLKPNGILLIAEPNSIPLYLWANNVTSPLSIDTYIDRIRFQHICETGKAILGEGWISAGEFIPGELAKLSAKDIQVFLSDKCNPLFPPYNQSIEQEILVKHAQESDQNEMWIWNKETTKRYFITAMRNEYTCIESSTLETEFEKNWELVKRIDNGILGEVTRGNYSTAGASVMYLITARKV